MRRREPVVVKQLFVALLMLLMIAVAAGRNRPEFTVETDPEITSGSVVVSETSIARQEKPEIHKGRPFVDRGTQTTSGTTTGTSETQKATERLPEATTSAEFDLFCRIVALEGHPKYGYELYLQVATVIMNRVKSDKFPDTVTGVVSQRNQFSTYKTDRKPVYNEDVYKAVEDAYYHGKRNLPEFVLAFITEDAYPGNVKRGGSFSKVEVYKRDNTVVWCYWPDDRK